MDENSEREMWERLRFVEKNIAVLTATSEINSKQLIAIVAEFRNYVLKEETQRQTMTDEIHNGHIRLRDHFDVRITAMSSELSKVMQTAAVNGAGIKNQEKMWDKFLDKWGPALISGAFTLAGLIGYLRIHDKL